MPVMEAFDFDTPAQGPDTATEKYALRRARFGRDDVLPLWVADMDFPTPGFITDALRQALSGAPAFGYPVVRPQWFEAVAHWWRRRHGVDLDRDAIVPVPGVVPGMQIALEACTQPGDGVIVMPPIYRPFFTLVEDAGRRVLECPLRLQPADARHCDAPDRPQTGPRYVIDTERLDALLPQARALLLCNPHNPGGRAWTPPELSTVTERCAQHGVLVVADEIHMDLILPPAADPSDAAAPARAGQADAVSSPPAMAPQNRSGGDALRDRHRVPRFTPSLPLAQDAGAPVIVFSSPGKTFNTAGLGGAYALCPDPALRRRLAHAQAKRHLGAPSGLQQAALIAAYTQGDAWPAALMQRIRQHLDAVRAALAPTPIRLVEPEATYLAWLDCRGLGLSAPPGAPDFDPDDRRLRRYFTHALGLGLSEGVWFSRAPDAQSTTPSGHEGLGFMRLNLATTPERLHEACARLARATAPT